MKILNINCFMRNGERNAGMSIRSLKMETMLHPPHYYHRRGEAKFETSSVSVTFAKCKIDVVQ